MLINELIVEDTRRSLLNKTKEVIFCNIFGHKRHFNVFKGRYNPKYCYICHKNIALWNRRRYKKGCV